MSGTPGTEESEILRPSDSTLCGILQPFGDVVYVSARGSIPNIKIMRIGIIFMLGINPLCI